MNVGLKRLLVIKYKAITQMNTQAFLVSADETYAFKKLKMKRNTSMFLSNNNDKLRFI